jgi:hypothetical protein
MLPYSIKNGKYILRKILSFEEYLSEVKFMTLNKINQDQIELSETYDPTKRTIIQEEISILSDRVNQIEQYLEYKKVVPSYSTRTKKGYSSVLSKNIAEWQRKVSGRRIFKILKYKKERI